MQTALLSLQSLDSSTSLLYGYDQVGKFSKISESSSKQAESIRKILIYQKYCYCCHWSYWHSAISYLNLCHIIYQFVLLNITKQYSSWWHQHHFIFLTVIIHGKFQFLVDKLTVGAASSELNEVNEPNCFWQSVSKD